MRSKIPKIISGILAIMLIVWLGYALLPPARFWIAFEFVSAMLVAVGCVGELYLFHLPSGRLKREKEKHHHLESRFILAVAVGVTMELFALSHAISEATRLEQDIASANERAGIAEQKAGEANERAANIESNNLVLQKELQPRIITLTQITNFIFLTEKIINVPVKISFASGRNETVNFAYQLRDMLNRAGFMPETNAGTWGINPDATHIWRRTRAGDTNWPSVYLYVYGTNGCFNSRFFAYEFTNKFARPIVNINDPETVGCAILFVLKQIGINTEEGSNSEIVKPNEFEFYIMDKAN